MSTTEPEELQGEPRWSSIRYAPHPLPAKWSSIIDEKLTLLVTQSTASGERFPVGVNWLEVSRVVRRSPVDCVKRYAFLHDVREQYEALEGEQEGVEEIKELEEELEEFLLESGDEYTDEQSLSNFVTPVTSPKLQSVDTFEAFVRSRSTSPDSPPPFAVTRPAAKQPGTDVTGGSPFRWESLVSDPNYTAPMLNSPPSLHQKQRTRSGYDVKNDESREIFLVSSRRISPQGSISPSYSEGQGDEMEANANYTASVLAHAFKGLKLGAVPRHLGSPLIGSPRLSRKISNIEYPFLKEEDISTRESVPSSSFHGIGGYEARAAAAPFLNDAYKADDAAAGDLQRQMNARLMRMSAMSSLHGDNPFSGSITQSALEDAFLDMAGSRLDASSVLLSSSASPEAEPQDRFKQQIEMDRTGAQDSTSKLT
ncbi:unnamed protein product [Peronospora belbahrii]|uniref:Myb-like domain-containing protein n=1 Tax=Peronospora belbahrii TaxID=622444 RepID=A0ABN8DAQ9_9STRA|nr:unnamed protein product [Peronospora belbahrii]